MRNLITHFPNQLRESIQIAETVELKFDRTITNVVICGLGGSGIGGEIVKEWMRPLANLSIEVCHRYKLPEYVNHNTLVIACSYSGNTEETPTAVQEAIDKKALLIGITSGGDLKNILTNIKAQYVTIPGGLPPRSALAYSLVQLIEIIEQAGVTLERISPKLIRAIELIEQTQPSIISLAQRLVEQSGSKKLMLYAEDQFHPVLLRTCQQLNENSKELAFYNVVPEMNHNEIVGWAKDPKDMFVVFVRSNLENSRNASRLDISFEIISDKTEVVKVEARGEHLIDQSLYLIHLFDWVSLLKAERKEIDVTEVKVIDYLKSQLASI